MGKNKSTFPISLPIEARLARGINRGNLATNCLKGLPHKDTNVAVRTLPLSPNATP